MPLDRIANPDIFAVIPDELLRRGVVNVIGLETVKVTTGERWEKSRTTIYSRLEAILQRKLGSSDFFTRLNDTAYLVSMPEVEREESRICCLGIALELHVALFGSCDLGEVCIFAGTPGDDDDTISLEAVTAAEMATLARKSGLEEMLAGASASPASAHGKMPARASEQTVAHAFWPLWDARRHAVIGYRCVRNAANAATANPAAVQMKARAELKLVLSALSHATAALSRSLSHSNRFLIDIPMSYETLNCPLTRMEIAAACRDLPAKLRPYLLFEISDVPRGVPASKLNDLVTALKPFCKSLIVHTPFRGRALAMQTVGHVGAVGLDMPIARVSAGEACSEIERLRDEAKRLSCMSLVSNIASSDLFRFAVAQGITLFSGPLIGKVLEPRPMYRLRPEEIVEAAMRQPVRPVSMDPRAQLQRTR